MFPVNYVATRFTKKPDVLWIVSRTFRACSHNLSPWPPSITRTLSRDPTLSRRQRPQMSGAAWSSCGTRWKTCVERASCARCWHKVSTWTRMTSRYCTGPDCTDYPLADFLPFIESPPFKTRSSRSGFFLWSIGRKTPAALSASAPRERSTRGQKAWFLPANSGPVGS